MSYLMEKKTAVISGSLVCLGMLAGMIYALGDFIHYIEIKPVRGVIMLGITLYIGYYLLKMIAAVKENYKRASD